MKPRRPSTAQPPLPPTLGPVASTLLIPLAARAFGDRMFPQVALGDAHAAPLLRSLEADVKPFLSDQPSIYGVLARSRVFRDQGLRFFARHPAACGASLGAGLGHYFQWFDNGRNSWIDADLPEVHALRQRLLPPEDHGRRRNAEVDLARPGWWQALGLPGPRSRTPVLLICEGVLMYLTPRQVRAFWQEVGEHAPPGSVLLFDFLCWLAVGHAAMHSSVRVTGAEFRWGLRRLTDLHGVHPRLFLEADYPVLDGWNLPMAAIGPAFRWIFGVPFYGVAQMGVTARERSPLS